MTRQERIPERIRRFVQRHCFSVAELEGLLLVRSAPQPAWDARELAERLYVREPHARLVLEALHRHGLMVRSDDTFLFGRRRTPCAPTSTRWPRRIRACSSRSPS